MYRIQRFDPFSNPTGYIDTKGVNKNEQIILYNSSLVCLDLEFSDHTTDTLPPSWVKTWTKESPIGKIKYNTEFVLNLGGQPLSTLYGTLYENGEHIQEVNTQLQYVYNVGNPGGFNVSTAQQVINEGVVNPQIILEGGIQNHTSIIVINTDGTATWQIWDPNTSTYRQIFNIRNTGPIYLQIGKSGDLIEVISDLFFDGTVHGNIVLKAGAGGYLINQDGNNVLGLQQITPYKVVTDDTLTSGTPNSYQITGNGGIPASAKWVLVSGYWQSVTSQAIVRLYGTAYANTEFQKYVLFGENSAANIQVNATALAPLDSNGKLNALATTGNVTFFNIDILAYMS